MQPPIASQDLADQRRRLSVTWAVPRGVIGWLSAADHKTIGRRFILTTFAFFLLGGVLALLMRVQLARPDNTFLDPDLCNQIFSLHGTTMMFLFAVPVMEAMAIYLVPLMLGTREIAFPRLVALAAGALAWRDWRRAGRDGSGGGAPPAGRKRFLGLLGLMLSSLFGLVIVAQMLSTLWFGARER